MNSLSQEIARFVVELKFEDLPDPVVHEAKRVLLDSIGCALAGTMTQKGKISIALAQRLGGPPESSIVGKDDKVSCCNAAFANGELINALDYDAVLYPPAPHVSPYVIPAPLAVAESVRASGKDLILATVLGHEITARLSLGLTEFSHYDPEKGGIRYLPAYGYSQCIFGGTAGAGNILKLGHKKMSHALGIAGYNCPVPTFAKWAETAPSAMTKYGSAGWLSTAATTAALLAEMGYTGDTALFDGEYGFWSFYASCASGNWEPDRVMKKLGETWHFLEIAYKPYPCCRLIHGVLDCFMSIIDKNNLVPENIESVRAFCHPIVEKPIWANNELATHVDAQFSVAYALSAAAHRIRVGADWQDLDMMRNTKLLEFMKKVSYQSHPGIFEGRRKDFRSLLSMVEVVAKGKTFREERVYPKGTAFTDAEMTDEELVEKFRHNACSVLTQDKIDTAVKTLLQLERVENITELMKHVTGVSP